MSNWQLPEGIEELAGSQAAVFESVRRNLIDTYNSWGYELVVPPMLEYVESLVLNSESIDQKTFKFLDSSDGQMVGVHADITPQIARIDSKNAKPEDVSRYCYVNTILQTKADDFYASRSPIQAGAELYGYKGIEADVEIIELMIESLSILKIDNLTLCLGNTSIFNSLCESAELSSDDTATLREIFRRKSLPDLAIFLDSNKIQEGDKFSSLIALSGDENILVKALDLFSDMDKITDSVNDLIELNNTFKDSNINLMFDLGEVKAYEYHDGVVFAVYHADFSKALAQGGRYNNLSQNFGSSRAATGFSFDLKYLIQQQDNFAVNANVLTAPNAKDPKLNKLINELRTKGISVKQDFSETGKSDFVIRNGDWSVKE
jgi:ATP phosphoribosyltransferase regulatory subunit